LENRYHRLQKLRDSEDSPLARHALERLSAAVFELDT
jgi:hypothetical protein